MPRFHTDQWRVQLTKSTGGTCLLDMQPHTVLNATRKVSYGQEFAPTKYINRQPVKLQRSLFLARHGWSVRAHTHTRTHTHIHTYTYTYTYTQRTFTSLRHSKCITLSYRCLLRWRPSSSKPGWQPEITCDAHKGNLRRICRARDDLHLQDPAKDG